MKQVIFLLVFILVIATPIVIAQDNKFEVESGVSYSTFALADLNQHLKARADYLRQEFPLVSREFGFEELKSGLGAYVQGRYWWSDRLALGAEIDTSWANTTAQNPAYHETYDLFLTGMLGQISYLLPLAKADLLLELGVGPYYSNLKWEKRVDYSIDIQEKTTKSYSGFTLGGEIGLSLKIPINPDLSFNTEISYRQLSFDQLKDGANKSFFSVYDGNTEAEEFDFSGLQIKNGLVFKF
ncbi:hypothetical protein JCM16358_13400 [Halanaerocella petrolearia]